MEKYEATRGSMWGRHTTEIDLQDEDYRGTVVHKVGGNCKGISILTTAISAIEDGQFEPDMENEWNKNHVVVDEDGFARYFKLYRPTGNPADPFDELHIDAEDIEDCVVGVRIVKFEKQS